MMLIDKSKIKGKRFLILGGTKISCEIVRAAKSMGIYVVVADYNPPEKSPAKPLADENYIVDVTNVDETVEFIKEHNIEGVLTGFSDMLLPYYAEICAKTNLPSYANKEQLELYTNKERYKELCRKFNVPTVKEYYIDINNFDETEREVEYPVLVKPGDGSGARGISICYNKAELWNAIAKAEKFSRSGHILVEKYLTGREVTVNWLMVDGQYYMTCAGNRHVKHSQEGVIPLPAGYTYPASVTESYIKNTAPKVKEMFAYSGLKNGMMFMQCKVENETCVIYDIGYRLTGTLEYKNITHACGYNPMELLIYFAMTGKMCEGDISKVINPFLNEYSFNISYLSRPGTIAKINGLEKVRNLPYCIDAVVAHEEGECITEAMKGLLTQITVRAFGYAKTREELDVRINEMQHSLSIIGTKEEDLLLKCFDKEDYQDYVADPTTRQIF